MSRLYDFIVRNGQIVTSESTFQGDIAIHDGKFAEISENTTIEGRGHQEIDATGLHVFPGLIDIHVHFNESGRSEWEGIATGSRSLAAGGVTTYVDMPLNSTPPVFTMEDLIIKRRLTEKSRSSTPSFGAVWFRPISTSSERCMRGVSSGSKHLCRPVGSTSICG